LIQPQNLPRPKHKNVDELIDSMPENFKGLDVQPLDALTSCLRGMIVASPGNRLICADFSSIEARVLAWMADHGRVVMSFVDGKDIYRTTAAEMYSTPYSEITDEQRFLGKVATLALGYQGGVRAFTKMAEAYGAFIDQELALRIRDYWREANKPIVNLWAEFERSAKRSLWTDGLEKTKVGPFKVHKSELLFRLPSDRVLVWQNPRLEINEKGWEQLRYDGTDPRTRKWTTRDTYGGDLVQSVTQAIARDLLAEAVLRLEKAGYPVVMHIHDEIIADVPKGFGSLKEFIKIMCELPTWAKGLPMKADGFETQRYKK
jgi:DNA polymerase